MAVSIAHLTARISGLLSYWVTHYSSTSFRLVNITPPSLIGQVEHPQISDVHCYLPFHFWLQNDLVPCSCSCSCLPPCPSWALRYLEALFGGVGRDPPRVRVPGLTCSSSAGSFGWNSFAGHTQGIAFRSTAVEHCVWSWMWGHLEVVVTSVIWYHINWKMGREMSRHGN